MFRISDLEFKIDDAVLDAFFDEDAMTINWGIKISGHGLKSGFERWKPVATIDIVFSMAAGEIAHWEQLSGRNASWVKKYNNEDEVYGSLYVFEHNPIYESNLYFQSHQDQLLLNWVGKIDINWDERYGSALQFTIETPVAFKGIWCGKKNKEESLKILGNFFNPDDFKYTQTEYGVSLLVPNSK